jgi:hypothetical protein
VPVVEGATIFDEVSEYANRGSLLKCDHEREQQLHLTRNQSGRSPTPESAADALHRRAKPTTSTLPRQSTVIAQRDCAPWLKLHSHTCSQMGRPTANAIVVQSRTEARALGGHVMFCLK